jgi:4-hydroxybenzoate polyprenyltransferase
MLTSLKYILISMRPAQWVKNLFIFAGLVFSRNLFNAEAFLTVGFGFVVFSLAASGIYIFNDIQDLENDKSHPEKRKRPLPSGRISIPTAYTIAFILVAGSLSGAFILNQMFFGILIAYLVMNVGYSLWLKHAVILDVMCIAFGFVFRVLAGTALANVRTSDWLLICTVTISLFLGFSKRRNEVALMEEKSAKHRSVLAHYSLPFLDQMIAVATACTVMSYALYTVAEETVTRFGTRNLVLTIPFVLYGIYRYLYLIHEKGTGGNPSSLVFDDKPLLVNCLLWVISAVIIIY